MGSELKVSVLVKCSTEPLYQGYTDKSIVFLEIPLGDYSDLGRTLYTCVKFIDTLGLGHLIKDELIKDIHSIRSILEKSEKGVKK